MRVNPSRSIRSARKTMVITRPEPSSASDLPLVGQLLSPVSMAMLSGVALLKQNNSTHSEAFQALRLFHPKGKNLLTHSYSISPSATIQQLLDQNPGSLGRGLFCKTEQAPGLTIPGPQSRSSFVLVKVGHDGKNHCSKENFKHSVQSVPDK